MENISVLGQSLLILAGGIALLSLYLGIVFYSWSLQLFKKIDFQINKMKQNIDNLEVLSQFVYETSYQSIKKIDVKDNQNEKITQNIKNNQHILEEIKADIQDLIQKQTEIYKKLEQKTSKEDCFSLEGGSGQILSEERREEYQNISKIVSKNLQDLLKEKEQVTVQELIYAMPDGYSLADIYQTLDIMKENKQIELTEKKLSPKSYIELTR